jgi:Cu(I)/Ag(I) efflux system membrane fusion protein
MNKAVLWMALVAAGLGMAGGYWLASHRVGDGAPAVAQAEKKPLFYRHPMNPAVTSPVPAKDEMGMDYVPVYEDFTAGTPPESSAGKPERRILYYKNPMGLPDTSPVPKKDSMGMDYVPVYAEEESQEGTNVLRVSPEKIQKLGVKTVPVQHTEIAHTVRSVGIIEADERRLHNVTLRFDGYIEKLFVNATGQSVARGQPLFEVYSPDLVSAQREYLTAKNARTVLSKSEPWIQSGLQDLAESSLERLRNWGISDAELASLEREGKVRHGLTVRSPASGVVMEKSAIAGGRASVGEVLFKIADLGTVWVIAQVYEQDIGLIEAGQTIQARLDAYPSRVFQGKVTFIYPALDPATRTARIRVELPNPKGLLKPMMYAQLEIAAEIQRALAVPRSAVLESGRRTLVLVERGEGRFEPRPVKLGMRGDELIAVLEGLSEHERVVTSANFLIDAESNLKAALGSFAAPSDVPEAASPKPPGHAGHEGM